MTEETKLETTTDQPQGLATTPCSSIGELDRNIVITIQSNPIRRKGGAGKSVTQYLLAHFLLQRGHKVWLYDNGIAESERYMPTRCFHEKLDPMNIEIRVSQDAVVPSPSQDRIEGVVQAGLSPKCGPFGGMIGLMLFSITHCLRHPVRTLQRMTSALLPHPSEIPAKMQSRVKLLRQQTFARCISGSYCDVVGFKTNAKVQPQTVAAVNSTEKTDNE